MGTEIWVIESLRPGDLKTGRLLTNEILKRAVAIKREIDVKFCSPTDAQGFLGCLDDVLQSAKAGNSPILHIEAHGDDDGIQLTNNDLMDWPDLSLPLVKINEAMKGWLVVTVAACSGGYMARTVLDDTRAPFFALVGPPEKIGDTDLLHDYTEFYVEYDKTRSITKARWALNAFRDSKQVYFFTTNRDCFVKLFSDRIADELTLEDQTLRIAELASKLVGPSATPEESIAAYSAAERVVKNPREFANLAWRKFVFADKYPENSDLFPFPFPWVHPRFHGHLREGRSRP